jgi:ABC-type bacteriocin/lantibiotic exporter with double-glycine peptidase domain
MIFNIINSFKSLLTKKQKIKLSLLIFLLLIGMILEFLGIGLLVPLLQVIAEPQIIQTNPTYSSFNDFIGISSDIELITILIISVISLYLFKSIFLVFLNFKQNQFIFSINANISTAIFKHYLSKNYSFHLANNSSKLLKILEKDVNYFNAVALSLIHGLTEFFLVIAIMISIIIINPIGAIAVGLLFCTLSIIFFYLTRGQLKKWGDERSNLEEKSSKLTLEGLNGIREVILYRASELFYNSYSIAKNRLSNVNAYHKTLNLLPRYYLELISVFILMGFVYWMIIIDEPLSSMVSVIGVFVAAAFKMIPSINKILFSFQNIKFYGKSLSILNDELNQIEKEKQSETKKLNDKYLFNDEILFDKVFFRYLKHGDWILQNINIKIKKGNIIGIIGESGSGKSTFLDLITGLQFPEKGKIFIDGRDLNEDSTEWHQNIGYVSQNFYLMDSTIIENIGFGYDINQINEEKVYRALEGAQLDKQVNKMKNGIYSMVGEFGSKLSGGQKQRIAIARALYKNPELLIFDEATSALDKSTENEILSLINNLKNHKTIIIVSHKIESLKLCDIIYRIEGGVINYKS